MPNVLTQPYRRPNAAAEDNFLATLAHPYDLREAVGRGASRQVALTAFLVAHPDGKAPIWALNANDVGKRAWAALSPGDLVLFYGYTEVYAYGFVSAKVLWPGNDVIWPSGADWDFVYSLERFTHLAPGELGAPRRRGA